MVPSIAVAHTYAYTAYGACAAAGTLHTLHLQWRMQCLLTHKQLHADGALSLATASAKLLLVKWCWQQRCHHKAACMTARGLTCHEAMHMEQRHDHQGLVLSRELVRGNDVGQTGRQVALVQWDTLQDTNILYMQGA